MPPLLRMSSWSCSLNDEDLLADLVGAGDVFIHLRGARHVEALWRVNLVVSDIDVTIRAGVFECRLLDLEFPDLQVCLFEVALALLCLRCRLFDISCASWSALTVSRKAS